jgi:hypothetical protein
MGKIIGISGRKQSGKNTVANYFTGYILKQKNMVGDFDISNEGKLEIQTANQQGDIGWGIFDATRKDYDFVSYADKELWPYTKLYHFADCLKHLAVSLFDLEPRQVYGTDEDKNSMTQYGKTAREFLQYFGTDVMRKIKNSIWVDYTIKCIKEENSEFAIIPDVRFPNEVQAIKEANGIVIRLDRDVYSSEHTCESSLDEENFDWKNFDYVIHNENFTLSKLIQDVQKLNHILTPNMEQ